MCQNHKSLQLCRIWGIFVRISGFFMCFHSFDILAKALAAVRDLKKICLTKNLRFVKKVSALRKTHLLPKYIKSPNLLFLGYIFNIHVDLWYIWEFLEIWENISLAECVKIQNRMIWATYEAFYTDLWAFCGVFENLGKRNYFQMYQNHNIMPFWVIFGAYTLICGAFVSFWETWTKAALAECVTITKSWHFETYTGDLCRFMYYIESF